MSLKSLLQKQFKRPSGTLGRLEGWLMAVSNRELSDWTVEKINADGTERILEVGYGPGITLKKIADRLSTGVIAGIDYSEVMYRMAQKRNYEHCISKKVVLRHGVIDDFSYHMMYFDTIYGNNVHFFWSDPVKEFEKLRLLLKPGGKLLMVFQPRWAKGDWEIMQMANRCRLQFEQAGFSGVKIELKNGKPVTMICVTGYARKPVNPKETKKKRLKAYF
jgi:SAM-dependent methyltransferase